MITFLGLGSNVDDRLLNLNQAIEIISNDQNIDLLSLSNFYESPPMYNLSLNSFLNGVIKVDTSYSPTELLDIIKKIERMMGRKKSKQRF